MSYQSELEVLARHTEVVELADDRGGRVAVCPEWQGRVMTSTCGEPEDASFGFVNRAFIEAANIEAGNLDEKFNNYGGEERFWLSPEGGPFSLWFRPGVEQTFDNWCTAPAINEGAWAVVAGGQAAECRMTTGMNLQNASAGQFELTVDRDVRLLDNEDFRSLFGDSAAEMLRLGGASTVGYETVNRITNRGDAWTKEKGLLSIWILGMFNARPETSIIVPYKSGDESSLGPIVKSDYFGPIPSERLKITPEAVLLAADGGYRCKIGTSQRRARNVLGSIDFRHNTLTLVSFTMPENPVEHDYMNNMWGPQDEPYTGDVANAYNDGANESGEQLGAFYEIESLSPTAELQTGESLEHRHRTIHIRAKSAVLEDLTKEVLGVDLSAVREKMGEG